MSQSFHKALYGVKLSPSGFGYYREHICLQVCLEKLEIFTQFMLPQPLISFKENQPASPNGKMYGVIFVTGSSVP